MTAVSRNSLGFGGYILPQGKTFAQTQTAAKVKQIAAALFCALLTAASCALPLLFAIPCIVLFSVLTVRCALAAAGAFNRAPPMQTLFPPAALAELPPLGQLSETPLTGFPTLDGPDAHRWKLELVKAARRSIVLSGCYCGGKPFQELLDTIQERLRLLPALSFAMTCSEIYMTRQDKKRVAELTREFGSRFSCVYTPEAFPTLSPENRLGLTCQHTKALVIDYGSYFLLGGTGIVAQWTRQTGEAHPPKHGEPFDFFIRLTGPRAFRDMDFVFRSGPQGQGARLYVEMMQLIERMRYRSSKEIRTPELPVPLDTPLPLFDERQGKVDGLKTALYAAGPEQRANAFHDALVSAIESAQKSIAIDHMYFHPTPRLLKALSAAAERGVRITLLTNRLDGKSPLLHCGFTELSRSAASKLSRYAAVELYEYAVPRSTLHKKAIVIDSTTTFLGSSNLGRKSLNSTDYEINLRVDSPPFAAAVLQSIESDKPLCHKIANPASLPLKSRLLAPLQSLCIPIL